MKDTTEEECRNTLHRKLRLSTDEEKRWKDIREFRFSHGTPERQFTLLFWRKALDAFEESNFICSSIMAGIASELAHKTRLVEQGVEMRKPNGRFQIWNDLINQYEKDDETKRIATKIKDEYRNVWIHPNYEELMLYLRGKGGPVTTDPEINISFASAKVTELLDLTYQLLGRLFGNI
jgi:hypothetical protein